MGTWAGGGEGGRTGVGSGWPQLLILLLLGGVCFRSSCIFEDSPGVGALAGGGEGGREQGERGGEWHGREESGREVRREREERGGKVNL